MSTLVRGGQGRRGFTLGYGRGWRTIRYIADRVLSGSTSSARAAGNTDRMLTTDNPETLRAAVETRQTVLISRGTGTGKTTLLNALTEYLPTDVAAEHVCNLAGGGLPLCFRDVFIRGAQHPMTLDENLTRWRLIAHCGMPAYLTARVLPQLSRRSASGEVSLYQRGTAAIANTLEPFGFLRPTFGTLWLPARSRSCSRRLRSGWTGGSA